ncbi:hypothetical protein ACIBAC_28985 [Streptomyces sp. NPDC051362]|uniref:hypothetical protein n=1 Tax=Streptomyces sp. NPDC051362 TaxID=3365651 RepID=UPI0037B0D572
MTDVPKTEDSMVAALLREREGYANRKGMEDRVTAVDEQLRLRGYSPDGERIDSGTGEDVTDDSTQLPPATPPEPATPPAPSPDPTPEVKNTQAPKGRRARGTEQA